MLTGVGNFLNGVGEFLSGGFNYVAQLGQDLQTFGYGYGQQFDQYGNPVQVPYPYPQPAAAGISTNTLLLIGGIVLAVVLLKK